MKDPFDDLPEANQFINEDSQSCLSQYMNYIRSMSKPILRLFKCRCGCPLFRLIKTHSTATITCKHCERKRVINKSHWKDYKVKKEERILSE